MKGNKRTTIPDDYDSEEIIKQAQAELVEHETQEQLKAMGIGSIGGSAGFIDGSSSRTKPSPSTQVEKPAAEDKKEEEDDKSPIFKKSQRSRKRRREIVNDDDKEENNSLQPSQQPPLPLQETPPPMPPQETGRREPVVYCQKKSFRCSAVMTNPQEERTDENVPQWRGEFANISFIKLNFLTPRR